MQGLDVDYNLRMAARLLLALLLATALPARAETPAWLEMLEMRFLDLRDTRDALDIAAYRGMDTTVAGEPVAEATDRYALLRAAVRAGIAAVEHPPPAGGPSLFRIGDDDARALAAIRAALEQMPEPGATNDARDAESCDTRPAGDFQTQSDRVYGCFSQAAAHIEYEGETLDRLTVFARLATTPGADRRKALWLSMQPIWRAVNAGNEVGSPYRQLIRLRAAEMQAAAEVPGRDVRGIGIDPQAMERWLLQALAAWRDSQSGNPIEPWDWGWQAGAAARALEPVLPVGRLRPAADTWYRALGADLAALNVHYDLEPRAGKDPVAFCTFGARPRHSQTGWTPGQPWVFATYRTGGLENLYELLHENGHAVHIAAIRTRPAFADWPDSDIFTEGVAELAALEVFDAAWQKHYLGAAASDADNRVARFSTTLMDMAWALFELRMLRNPDSDPNTVWTELTHEYLRIAPHPEYSWWAVRGQLVGWPGYMMNYAAGAIMAADLRARITELKGSTVTGDPGWYAAVREALFRYGQEKSSAEVLADFLGRPVSPGAFLRELGGDSGPGPP